MTLDQLRDEIRAIINQHIEPLTAPYWDDGAADLNDEGCDELIAAIREAFKDAPRL